LHYFLIFSIFV